MLISNTTIILKWNLPSIYDKVFWIVSYFLVKTLVMEANLCIVVTRMEDYGLDVASSVSAKIMEEKKILNDF